MAYGIDKLFVFAFGTIIGSFLNVCIHRMPINKSIVFPYSHCPKCNKSLYWYDNVPVLSYAMLLGKCRSCREKISLIYPLVEIITASLMVSLYLVFGFPSVKFFVYSAFMSALIAATFIDIDINEIPDSISLGGLVAGFVLSFSFPALFDTNLRGVSLLNSLAGALVGGGTIYAMGAAGKLVFRKEAMGGGDVKLMAMIGSIIGWKLVLFTFFMAPVFGAGVGIIMKLKDGRETIAYGPYLSLAAIIAVFWGDKVLRFLFY